MQQNSEGNLQSQSAYHMPHINNSKAGGREWETDTARWTSSTYRIKFAAVGYVDAQIEGEQAFDLSAYGISSTLRTLLEDYSDGDLRIAAAWVAAYQNHDVANALQSMAAHAYNSGADMPELQDVFIAIEADLYLPGGLKMPVTCVTNIVPHGNHEDRMDKFVAVLDPSETRFYIDERVDFIGSQDLLLH